MSVPRLDFQSHISVFLMFNDLRFHVCFLDTLFSYVSHSILSFVIVGLHHILLVVFCYCGFTSYFTCSEFCYLHFKGIFSCHKKVTFKILNEYHRIQ